MPHIKGAHIGVFYSPAPGSVSRFWIVALHLAMTCHELMACMGASIQVGCLHAYSNAFSNANSRLLRLGVVDGAIAVVVGARTTPEVVVAGEPSGARFTVSRRGRCCFNGPLVIRPLSPGPLWPASLALR